VVTTPGIPLPHCRFRGRAGFSGPRATAINSERAAKDGGPTKGTQMRFVGMRGVRAVGAAALAAALAVVGLGTGAANASASTTRSCSLGTYMWNINGDNALHYGTDINGRMTLVSYGALDFAPNTVTYVNTTGRNPLVKNFLASTPAGELRLVKVTIRTSTTGTPSYAISSTVLSTAWHGVRIMESAWPFLYSLDTSGGLTRYTLTNGYFPAHRYHIAMTGWGGLRSMSFGGTLLTTDGKTLDSMLMLTPTGLNHYLFPHDAPQSWFYGKLKTTGWNVFKHVSVGGCTGPAAPVVGITPAGAVYEYIDANGYDLYGGDFSKAVYRTSGWAAEVNAD
jgi:hypothetical protein